ncbi:uncharacterized protein An13g01650 [Aspergillus niger]|uniref:Contig An13c0060, genomic contig n=2 Tax=Aspergillus niger TaxID=5061 RepID=A2R1L5_ASPNC|nr:uncharacterized protein An13g01650 [Aspergillus niger]CAK41565.1 unnamed protein product [Aspergillus niger]
MLATSNDNGPTDRNCGVSPKPRTSIPQPNNQSPTYPNILRLGIPPHQTVVLHCKAQDARGGMLSLMVASWSKRSEISERKSLYGRPRGQCSVCERRDEARKDGQRPWESPSPISWNAATFTAEPYQAPRLH